MDTNGDGPCVPILDNVGLLCAWCGQSDKPNSYILPLKHQRHTFCSETCLFEFRKGACCFCGIVISGSPFQSCLNMVTRDFCNESCCEKFSQLQQKKQKPLATNSPKRNNSSSKMIPALSSPSVLSTNPSSFLWEDYLAETESVAAPKHCFKQVSY